MNNADTRLAITDMDDGQESRQDHAERYQSETTSHDDSTDIHTPSASISRSSSRSRQSTLPDCTSPRRQDSAKEDLKCWICLQSADEDTASSSAWRAPCACTLRAHEDCLLDWIADVQKGQGGRPRRRDIACPQCKTPIVVLRPSHKLADLIFHCALLPQRLAPWTLGGAALAGLVCGCYCYGLGSVWLVFGQVEAERDLGIHLLALEPPNLALLLVAPTVVASSFRMADVYLAGLSLAYISCHRLLPVHTPWSSTPSSVLVALPIVRQLYRLAYKTISARYERAWQQQMQPRRATEEDGMEPQDAHVEHQHGIDIELGFQVVVEQEEDEGDEEAIGEEGPAVDNEPDRGPEHEQQRPENGPEQAPAPRAANHVPVQIMLGVILERFVGGLLLPVISAGVGMAFKAVLPHRWMLPQHTTATGQGLRSTVLGLLQTNFGRSMAGGCLFIVFRDSLLLYAKYKYVQSHQQRRIQDYHLRTDRPSH